MKKKFSKELLKNIVIFILIGICGGLTIWNLMLHTAKQPEAKVGKIIYEQANDPLEEVGFYPGRAYGDYYDLVFCFDDYLNSVHEELMELADSSKDWREKLYYYDFLKK